MFKKYFTFLTAFFALSLPVFAQDAIFSNSSAEQFNLKPLNYTSKPVVYSSESTSSSKNYTNNTQGLYTRAQDSALSDKNFVSAVSNLDNAQVEIREQLASYSALMAQSKTAYEAKRNEYKQYKKQYNALKKKMKSVERSKKLIQNNMTQQTYID